MLKAIKTKKEHEEVLKRIYKLMQGNLKPGSLKMNELEVLSILADKYEDEHFPIDPPNPIEAIKFQMEHLGLTQSEMSKYLGNKSRVSDVLKRKRKLSLRMIRNLHKNLKIPAEILIKEY